jgi:MFS family permease
LWTKNFIQIALINLLIFCGFQMFPAALPPYVKSLGADDHLLGWLTGAATLSTLIVRPFAGLALDKFGRRGTFMAGLLFLAAATFALYFFPLVSVIILLRFAHGLGWGVTSTSSNTIAADYIPRSRFGEGMGYFSLSAALALAISPAIGLALPPGQMFLLATALVLAALALAQGLHYRRPPPAAPAPRKTRTALYERAAFLPALVIFMVTSAYGANMTFLAVYASSLGIGNIGPFFTAFALTLILIRPFIGKFIDRRGYGIILVPGLILLILTFILFSRASSLADFLLCAVTYGLGQGCVITSTQAMAVTGAPANRRGAATATFFTGFDGGMGFGAVSAGFAAGFLGYSSMYLALLLFPLAGLVIFLISRAVKTT